MSATENKLSLSELLHKICSDHTQERVSVADLLSTLGDRALGGLLFIFALPNILPTPPGTSAVLGAPLIFLTAQLALGQRPWLPAFIGRQSLPREDFLTLINRVTPWLAKTQKLLRPRASVLVTPPMEYLIGFISFLLSIVLLLPIPLGNILPALAISLMALGILEKDGLWVLAGLFIAVLSSVVVSGVVFGMIKAVLSLVQRIL